MSTIVGSQLRIAAHVIQYAYLRMYVCMYAYQPVDTHHIYQCYVKEYASHCRQDPVQSNQRRVAHRYPNKHAEEGS